MNTARWLYCYRCLYVGYIVYASAQAVLDGHHAFALHNSVVGHSGLPEMVIGTIEIMAALLLLARRTQFAGMVLLLLVFAVATAATLASGEVPARFFYYAGTAMLIVWIDRKRISGNSHWRFPDTGDGLQRSE